MTNIEKILFDSKFSIKYMNGEYYISGFDHLKTLRVNDKNIKEVLETIHSFNQSEWEDFIKDHKG